MTTRTHALTGRRTTRATLTRIVAAAAGVLALVATSVAFSATAANANDKVWICHADTNNVNGQPNLGEGGTGGEYQIGFNLIEVSQEAWVNAHQAKHPNDSCAAMNWDGSFTCGTPNPGYDYSVSKSAAMTICVPSGASGATTNVSVTGDTVTVPKQGTSVTDAQKAAADQAAQANADAKMVSALFGYPGYTKLPCPTSPTYTRDATVADSGYFCSAQSATTLIDWTSGKVTRTSKVSYDDAYAMALADATVLAAQNKAAKTAGFAPGACNGQTVFKGAATSGGVLGFCQADKVTDLSITFTGSGSASSLTSQVEADNQAKAIANANAQADLNRQLPAGATSGACAPAGVSAAEAATLPEEPVVVAAPEPATVVAPEPATVAVPMKATVPTAVRAGDGSSDEGGPSTGLMMLALAAAGVCLLATARLVLVRTQ
jgi:hypothetical protein